MKTKEEILNQPYLTAQDIKTLIPVLGINSCINIIKDIRKDMSEKNYFIPPGTKPMLAHTGLFRKKYKI